MTISAQMKRNNWEARLARINSGQTYTQCAAAEGTVPMQGSRMSVQARGVRGIFAWMLGGALGWGIGMMAAVANPAALFLDRVPLPEAMADYAAMIESWGNPLLALFFFMLIGAVLRIQGAFPRFIGLVVMAYIFALQMNVGTPTVAELIEMGQGFVTNEEGLAAAVDAVRDWALQKEA